MERYAGELPQGTLPASALGGPGGADARTPRRRLRTGTTRYRELMLVPINLAHYLRKLGVGLMLVGICMERP